MDCGGSQNVDQADHIEQVHYVDLSIAHESFRTTSSDRRGFNPRETINRTVSSLIPQSHTDQRNLQIWLMVRTAYERRPTVEEGEAEKVVWIGRWEWGT